MRELINFGTNLIKNQILKIIEKRVI
jgi:hypothetical protein